MSEEIGAADSASLFGGTYLEFLGFKLTDWQEGFVRLEMAVRPEHRNTIGYLHGGVIASLLDIAGAFAGSHKRSEEYVAVTVNLNTSYMAPTTSNTVIAEGELIRKTKKLFFAQARVIDPENSRLCATATGTYMPKLRESRVPTQP